MNAHSTEQFSCDLPDYVIDAIKCGAIPNVRDTEEIPTNELTKGEKVITWAESCLIVPEGNKTNQKLELDIYQKVFILAVFDNPALTSLALLSMARRNGKTFVIAVILLAFIIGPLKERNTTLCSAAQSKEQAATVFELMIKMLDLSPLCDGHYKYTLSSKTIIGLKMNVQYRAISSEAKTGHGKAYKIILLDEAGQIGEESNAFVEMLETSQSNYEDAMMFIISTQAASDRAYFSQQLDIAETTGNPHMISHVYAADEGCDMMDERQWQRANPGLGKFRTISDMRKRAEKAEMLPSAANGVLNLNFNQRVSLMGAFMSPHVWKGCLGDINVNSRGKFPIDIGIDLSLRTDLTAAVACWKDGDGNINVETHAFAPLLGVEQREIRDKAPYQQWAKDGWLNLTPGATVDYEYVAKFLASMYRNCEIRSVQFDRWKIDNFKRASKEGGTKSFYSMVPATNEEKTIGWIDVGQGYVSMAPRLESFEAEALRGVLLTGNHPILNFAASQAIAVSDDAGSRKLAKSKSVHRIDPIQAAIMAVYPNSDGAPQEKVFDVAALIGALVGATVGLTSLLSVVNAYGWI